jgi:GntR family transcriptional regulator
MAAKYITIAREIKKRIISQQYAANEPLPDQFALAAEFSTSRMTIQQAMRQLIVEGLVYTRQGQGTFIRKNFLQLSQWDLSGSDYFGATKTWEHLGTVTSQVVHFELRFPNEKEQASLMINADAPIYDFIRLRLLNGEPMSLDSTVMPMNLVPGLTKTILKVRCFSTCRRRWG